MNNQFLLIFDNLQQLQHIIANYKTVHVFIDESVDISMQQKLFEALKTRVDIIKTVFAPCYATQTLADSLAYRNEDFVLAVGKLHLQSLAKYYCYANNLEYGIIPVKEISEYSFSKYAYLKDDKFCFYVCDKPSFAYINNEYFNTQDILKLKKILSYKNIVGYEKEFENVILKKDNYDLSSVIKSVNLCNGSLKSVIKLYSAISMLLETTKTSKFLGSEYIVLSLLATNKQDISTNLINCTNLLARFYECFNKFKLIRVTPNINLHLQGLKKQYGLTLTQANKYILSAFSNDELKKIEYTFRAYEPHLKVVFNNAKTKFMFSKINFKSQSLEKALALSPSLSGEKTLLRLTRDLGYFENLLK